MVLEKMLTLYGELLTMMNNEKDTRSLSLSENQLKDWVECRARLLVVVQKVWVQVSADYDASERTRILAVTPETTVGEVMRWAAAGSVLGRGDVVLTEQDHAA
jgi:hypothetical protein